LENKAALYCHEDFLSSRKRAANEPLGGSRQAALEQKIALVSAEKLTS
jgi:hypothetical protein